MRPLRKLLGDEFFSLNKNGKAYSDDLRRKVLETREQGEGTLEDLAKRFRVSLSWTKKILAAYSLSGKMERPTGAKRGRKSKVTPESMDFYKRRWKRKRT